MELCSVCSQLDPFLRRREERILGPYDDLLLKSQSLGSGRAGCGGCAFFCIAIRNSARWCDRIPELSGSIIVLDLDGLHVRASSGPIDFLHERLDFGLTLSTFIVEEATDLQSFNNFPHMRLVPSDPRENSCFTLISRWMDQCTKHSDCSPPVPVELPKRVIEIPVDPLASPKLRMTNGALGRYVILSHCWGTRGLTTLTNSLLPHYQEGIRPELLPNSFRDAIEITRRLGFQYLWIDALCIIQNDAEDWAEEAAKMASYYGLSTLMISATAAEDSSRGILKPRDALRSPILGIRKRFFLCQDLLRSGIEIDRSVLATRGWAAQERMLAPRVLHYTKQQMIWECAEGLFCEAFSDTRVRSAARAGYCKAKCQQFVTEALSQENTVPRYQDHNAKMRKRSFESISLDRIETWHQCVGMYSSRSLTVPTDKLHAIAGVARMLNHSGQLGGYLAGIWSMRLAVSLAWKKESEMLSSPPSYTAPSWSWAGVEGEVKCGFDYPQTPCDDADKSWAKRWYPKLTEQHMILQNEHNIYGAVLEGSYITVEGACLALADLGQFLREVDRIYSRNLPFHSHRILLDREDWLYDPATYDCCMYLIGVPAHDGFIDLLLLSWLDREASVAQRVGIAEIRPRRVEEDREPLFNILCQELRAIYNPMPSSCCTI